MRIIKSTRLRDIQKQRRDYVNKYNNQKAQHEAETIAYDAAAAGYEDKIKFEILQTIGYPALEPFSDNLDIRVNRRYGSKDYYITISYSHPRVPFDINIYVSTNGDDREVVHAPSLDSRGSIQPEDYDVLLSEIELFKRIDSIQWMTLFDNAREGKPKYEDYVKTEHPGTLNLRPYTSEFLSQAIQKTKNSDEWLLLYANRGYNFNEYRSNAKDPDVNRCGWFKLVKETSTAYQFHWLQDNSYISGRSVGMRGMYSTEAVKNAESKIYKFKKEVFELPPKSGGNLNDKDESLHYLSTEELYDSTNDA